MTRRIYFSFHYQDVIDLRANVVRNHWVTRTRGEAGFFDASIWGNAKRRGDTAVRCLIAASPRSLAVPQIDPSKKPASPRVRVTQ